MKASRVFCCFVLWLTSLLPTLAAPGDLDLLDTTIVGATVNGTVLQPDGKVILIGEFSSVLGVARNNIARLNADDTLDLGFDPNADGEVRAAAVQADGKIVIGGVFTTLQPNGAGAATTRNFVARLNPDGSLDAGFDPNPDAAVTSLALQADGRVLVSGQFTAVQPNGAATPTTRNRVARFQPDGTLDAVFNPNANGTVLGLTVQGDGKVLLGGQFTTIQPNGAPSVTARSRAARVNADGSLDATFDPVANSDVFGFLEQADGKVLLYGLFTVLQPNGATTPATRNRIARLNVDGTLDAGFDPNASNAVRSLALQADGKVLLGGQFTTLQPNGAVAATTRSRLARVNPDGTLDAGFDPAPGTQVNGVVLQADGRVLVMGNFGQLQPNGAPAPTNRSRLARLQNDEATQTIFTEGSTQAFWQRGGAGPELSRVTFELSVDGGVNWTPLGPGTRIGTTPDWQCTGLSLPEGGKLRTRGVALGGLRDSTSSLIEQVATFGPGALTDLNGGVEIGIVSAAAVQADGKVVIGGAIHEGERAAAAEPRPLECRRDRGEHDHFQPRHGRGWPGARRGGAGGREDRDRRFLHERGWADAPGHRAVECERDGGEHGDVQPRHRGARRRVWPRGAGGREDRAGGELHQREWADAWAGGAAECGRDGGESGDFQPRHGRERRGEYFCDQ